MQTRKQGHGLERGLECDDGIGGDDGGGAKDCDSD